MEELVVSIAPYIALAVVAIDLLITLLSTSTSASTSTSNPLVNNLVSQFGANSLGVSNYTIG